MSDLPRRSVLLGAAAAGLTACAGAPETAPSAAPSTGAVLTAAADVPVGSGTVVDGTLITQPSAGVFKGFVARCTHAGCALNTVTGDAAVCRCHGSAFGLDGQVLRGPATEALTPRPVALRGEEIVAG